ncbi:hypothetical protein Gotri_026525 [Gossypium trilobum]|uniref:Uncharacterized protein n=1 Tax=Gossypium trilobum TaxID=34281 RepID=A0A7J9FJD0_9ROSI|nr:hypothetical protein [Gossypium trilobum]
MDGSSLESSGRGHRMESFLVLPNEILYRCGDFDWVPLLGIWRAVGYAPLLVLRRINDNIPKPSQGNSQSIEEHLRVVPSELEIIRQDFERRIT